VKSKRSLAATRLISAGSLVYLLAAAFVMSAPASGRAVDARNKDDGQTIFRYDTFGDEQLWTDVLRMHEVIPTISPATALGVGLKVDVDALPAAVTSALQAGAVDLNDPSVTLDLLRLNAVVGVKGTFDRSGQLTKVGVTCALCHSSVDNSFAPGIGRRLDGWPNSDLNVGVIAALSPTLDETTKGEFRSWGPGKYDPRHHAFDGVNIMPLNSPTLPVLIPPIYGLNGVGFETYTADGPISYWNSYVGVTQMGGHGSFSDSRIGLSIQAETGSRHSEASGSTRLSTEPACAEAGGRHVRCECRETRARSVRRSGSLQFMPPGAELHRCPQRPGSQRAAAAQRDGSRR
jgi:hypothetical protein